MEETAKIYDVIVIGAGPGGMTAALYTSRSNLSTLMLERGAPGGQMINTAEIENYPGFGSIMGPDLSAKMFENSQSFGADYKYGDIQDVIDHGNYKEVQTSDKTFYGRSIIVATGSENKKLDVEGESEFNGRGVSYCAVCDGAFFKEKHIVVVGGGDSAVEEGHYLTQFADKVTIIHRRDELRAQQILQDRAFNNDKIEFLWNSEVEEIQGEGTVKKIKIRNSKTDEIFYMDAEGAFIYIGLLPNSTQFSHLGITDEEGWIVTDENMETSVPGIFAVGDVRKTVLRQVATAVGDGSIAGNAVFDYIEGLPEEVKNQTTAEV